MLKPSMQELLNKVENRYLLVNLAAQRARDLSDFAEDNDEPLDDKPVKLALDEIVDGSIKYCHGPRVETVIPTVPSLELAGAFGIDLDDEDEEAEELDEEAEEDE